MSFEEANGKGASTAASERKKTATITTNGAGGTSAEARACAACKYQRRRCAPDCLLAPYFQAENHQQFINAHKLFGLKKLTKVLEIMKQPQKDLAIKSMIYEANVRANDPVGGTTRIVMELEKQIGLCNMELEAVKQQIAWWRAQAELQNIEIAKTFTAAPAATAAAPQNRDRDDIIESLNVFYTEDFDYNIGAATSFVLDDGEIKAVSKDASGSCGVGNVQMPSQDRKVPISDKIVPKIEAQLTQPQEEDGNSKVEAGLSQPKPEHDLKDAASQFSLKD